MKKIILIITVLLSLNVKSQQLSNKTCYMLQGSGIPYGNLTVSNWSANNLGKQKFYYDVYNRKLYIYDYGLNEWTLINISQTIQQVAEYGNTLDALPLNFKSGGNESSINSEKLVFYSQAGISEYGNGAMQVKSNDGNYILINPDLGLLLKTKKDGANGGSELVLKSDNLTNTRFQQATDANGIVPVIEFVEFAPNVNDIGKAGQMKIKDTTLYMWTEFGWKSITLN